jgi:predicted Zn-dependent protease
MLLLPILAALLAQPVQPAESDSASTRACPAVTNTDLAAAIAAHGGAVRWAVEERAERPVTVWVQRRPADAASERHDAREWQTALVDGITAWNGVVAGLRLAIAGDSVAADVRVVWAPTLVTSPNDADAGALASLTAGRTTLVPDDAGRAVTATVVLARTAPNGAPYLPRDVRAVTQHEIGHALGLAHHASPASVMAPMVTAERIGDADRAVLRALYALPVGACRASHDSTYGSR